eukprot:1359643-Prymnesium_polylepis.1
MCDDTHATRRIQKQQRVGRPQHTSVGKVLSVPRASRTRDGNTHKHHTHSATRAPKPPSRDPHTPPHVVSRVLSCDSQLRLSGRASLPKRYRKCARAIKPLSLWVITAINVQSNPSACGSSPQSTCNQTAQSVGHHRCACHGSQWQDPTSHPTRISRHPAPNAGCTLQPQCSASRHQCQPTVGSSWDPRGIHGGILVRSS